MTNFKDLFEGKDSIKDIITLLNKDGIKTSNVTKNSYEVSFLDVKDMRETLGKSNSQKGTKYFVKTTQLDSDTYKVTLGNE